MGIVAQGGLAIALYQAFGACALACYDAVGTLALSLNKASGLTSYALVDAQGPERAIAYQNQMQQVQTLNLLITSVGVIASLVLAGAVLSLTYRLERKDEAD